MLVGNRTVQIEAHRPKYVMYKDQESILSSTTSDPGYHGKVTNSDLIFRG